MSSEHQCKGPTQPGLRAVVAVTIPINGLLIACLALLIFGIVDSSPIHTDLNPTAGAVGDPSENGDARGTSERERDGEETGRPVAIVVGRNALVLQSGGATAEQSHTETLVEISDQLRKVADQLLTPEEVRALDETDADLVRRIRGQVEAMLKRLALPTQEPTAQSAIMAEDLNESAVMDPE